jgi:hypothetical protein
MLSGAGASTAKLRRSRNIPTYSALAALGIPPPSLPLGVGMTVLVRWITKKSQPLSVVEGTPRPRKTRDFRSRVAYRIFAKGFPYPFVLGRLMSRLWALFFLCLFSILLSASFCPADRDAPNAGPLVFVAVALLSCGTVSMQESP